MKPISSVISGSENRALQAASLTGGQHGETGLALGLSADPRREMHPAVMARTPSANTEAALSRMQRSGVTCSVKMETVFPTTPDGDTTFRQRATSLTVNTASSHDLIEALRIIQESLLPASVETIEEWLAELSVKTARRKESSLGTELALSVYTSHLRQYPADAVRHTLTGFRGQWFPTWGELADRLDELVEPRVMIRDRLLEMAQGKGLNVIEHMPKSALLDEARGQLADLNRVTLRFPETDGPETQERRERLLNRIAELERS